MDKMRKRPNPAPAVTTRLVRVVHGTVGPSLDCPDEPGNDEKR